MNRLKFKSRLKDFDLGLFVKNGTWNGKDFILRSDLIVELPNGEIETVPAGFITNLGSIPRLFRSMVDKAGYSIRAYVFHDWIYSKGKLPQYSRLEKDKMLYQLGRDDGEGYWTAQTIQKGLLVGGWVAYNKSEARIEKNSKRVIQYIAKSNGFELADKYENTDDVIIDIHELGKELEQELFYD